jgi:hypothetical protein
MKPVKILSLIAAVWCGACSAFAQTWTQTSAPSNNWASVASSADGSKLVAAAGLSYGGDGLIYISTNSGVGWMPTSAPTDSWTTVASSADGTKLVAAASGDLIYISTNSGFSWVPTSAPSNYWTSVASSANGSKLLAAANSDLIYFSTNSGSDWMPADAPVASWESVACSADGTKAVAANGNVADNQVWISEDSGATWTQADLPSQNWSSVCSSADGNKLAAVGISTAITFPGGRSVSISGGLGISTNSGPNWTTNDNFNASSIASSADGNKLIAGNGSGIYISTDLGTTWIQETNISAFILAFSADGNKSVVTTAVTDSLELPGGRTITTIIPGPIIYTSFSIPTPSINIAPTNGNLALSWLIPSTNFVLQQNFDLTTTNWTDMTNTPVLNLTNLQNQVFLPLPASNSFYRLATP